MITNVAKPSSSLTNSAKVVGYETWASITTTYASETRTWAETGTIFTNALRPSSSLTNIAKPA